MSENEEIDYLYFSSIKWCAKLLEDQDFKRARTTSRQVKSSNEDAFFAETLKADDTIPKCLSMYRTPRVAGAPIEEVRTLLQLGYRLNGYPGIAHGGVQCFLLDEVMALLLSFNKDLEGGPIRPATVTASLQVSFLKPVKTPSVVLVTAKLKGIQGRKYFVTSTISDESGVILAKANALWIAISRFQEEKL